MKKKIFSGAAVLAVAVVAALNVNFNAEKENSLSLTLANVEALASESSYCIGNSFRVDPTSYGWICYSGKGSSCCPTR